MSFFAQTSADTTAFAKNAATGAMTYAFINVSKKSLYVCAFVCSAVCLSLSSLSLFVCVCLFVVYCLLVCLLVGLFSFISHLDSSSLVGRIVGIRVSQHRHDAHKHGFDIQRGAPVRAVVGALLVLLAAEGLGDRLLQRRQAHLEKACEVSSALLRLWKQIQKNNAYLFHNYLGLCLFTLDKYWILFRGANIAVLDKQQHRKKKTKTHNCNILDPSKMNEWTTSTATTTTTTIRKNQKKRDEITPKKEHYHKQNLDESLATAVAAATEAKKKKFPHRISKLRPSACVL